MGMAGWIANPHGPETVAVQKVYKELAALIQATGTDKWMEVRQKLVLTLRTAEETLLAGKVPWDSREHYKRLLLLNDQANAIFVYLLEHFEGCQTALPPELTDHVRAISDSLTKKRKEKVDALHDSHEENKIVQTLIDKLNEARVIIDGPLEQINRELSLPRQSLVSIFGGAFDKNSIVFLTSVRFGVVLLIAALVAYSFEFNRSYWITLSCAAVMSGSTIIATFHRQIHDLAFFATARVIDVVIGCGIGLIGTSLIGRRKASSLLPHLIAKTIRSQQQYLFTLFSEHRNGVDIIESSERRKMQTNITNLKLVYETAIGEIPSNKVALEMIWPVVFSIVQVGYLLESCLKSSNCPILSDKTLSQLLLVFETMAKSAEQKAAIPMKHVPEIRGFTKLQKKITDLQDALQLSKRAYS